MTYQNVNEKMGEIDLVNFPNKFSAFMYSNDQIYKEIPDEMKHYNQSSHINDLKCKRKPNYSPYNDVLEPINLFERIMEIYWNHSIDFSIIDVGSSYGLLSMEWATFIKKNNHHNRVFAFDCGVASVLCDYNIRLNLLNDLTTFERKAVTNNSLPQQVFFESSHSEDNHITRRRDENLSSYIVDGITLDEYFKNDDQNHVIKIDTQGAEPLVFEGMKLLFSKRPPVLFEFTPYVIDMMSINPIDFLKSMPEDYSIFEFQYESMNFFEKDPNKKKIFDIPRNEIEDFVKSVLKSTISWTNLFIISENTKVYDYVVKEIKKSPNYIGNKFNQNI